MDRHLAKQVTTDAEAALRVIAAKYGLTLTCKGCSFSSSSVKPKVEFFAADAPKTEWDRYCGLFGLKPEQFGKSFVSGGVTYTVAGLRTSAPRRPVLATRNDGKTFVFPAEFVKAVA